MKIIQTLTLASLLGFNTIYAQTFEWAKRIGNKGDNVGHDITVDASGNVFTMGVFQGTADFDPGTGISNLTAIAKLDYFVQKLDAKGNFVWAKSMGGIDYQEKNICSIALDPLGNICTIGTFQGTADFDPGMAISNHIAVGSNDNFVEKLDANGNFKWITQVETIDEDYSHSIAVDALGNVYTTGNFRGTADFDPGIGINNLSTYLSTDLFVQKLNTNGNFEWARQLGSTYNGIHGYSIALDPIGNIYTTGYFYGTIDFDPGVGTTYLSEVGRWDVFVHKMSQTNTVLATDLYQSVSGYNTYPNPVKDKAFIELGAIYSNVSVTVSDITGVPLLYTTHQQASRIELSLENLPSGVYIITLNSEGKSLNQKLVRE